MCDRDRPEGMIQEHGGLDPAALRARGISPDEVLDYSVNINPFGACEGVYRALRNFRPEDYPERRAETLTEKLAQLNGVESKCILVGNGTAELIWLAAFARLRGANAVVFSPGFGEYAKAARAAGAELHFIEASPPDFRWDLDAACRRIRRLRPGLTFLCNPNNPTGVYLSEEEIGAVAEACGNGLLVLDEAYRSFITRRPFDLPLPGMPSNLLVLRSMTKDFALAGLRLGYALGDEGCVAELAALQPPWSVNGAAQAAGLAAAADLAHLERTLDATRRAALELRSGLAQSGVRYLPSETPFCLVDVSPYTGNETLASLLAYGIQVRDCTSFGLTRYVRIGTRRPEENARLLEAWRAWLDTQD